MNITNTNCHPTFSTIDCGWEPTNVNAAYAVWAALFVASASAAGTLLGGVVTRLAHLGWEFNLMMEATLASMVAALIHIVLWLGPTILRNGGSPYPTWLSLLFWSLPFIMLVRAQFMSFTTMYAILLLLKSALGAENFPVFFCGFFASFDQQTRLLNFSLV
jgi:hypothetical protein